ncbi:flagellar hook-length control protein FliK [Aromatoleum diolicum]|uniref:Flagellar hook-length control protein FliK n=1 Tax=Aromatoleum diolicum TaxID=75796 RepID=A0ABX1QGB8_9RHOO|nr:flagellar hook-length control protein FliK [Aromatoleum diolicum]NMG76397.1 flagellar hook-length control protein FliK [Aromatoleum diolicum]
MIPSDLAARLRMLTEASLFDSEPPIHGPARVREIQARLPELAAGEKFTATLQRSLPDGTFQAIVAGKSYTLALNHAAKAGDTLELVVTQSTPKAVFAQLAQPGLASATASADASRPNLSAVGRLIGFLLTGQPDSPPATLAAGKPLLNAPPANNGAALATVLRQAIAQSGLFYESHQLQWISGKVDTAALLQEPQGQQSPARAQAGDTPEPGRTTDGRLLSLLRPTPEAGASVMSQATSSAAEATDGAEGASNPNAQPQGGPSRATVVPERLIPVVHQQLDAMATQNYVWQGQVWPGQAMEWEIEDPQRDHQGDAGDAPTEWNTTVRLSLPRLGGVEARLILTPAGVALRLQADDADTVKALDEGRQQLDAALSAANVPLTGFVAERRDAGR